MNRLGIQANNDIHVKKTSQGLGVIDGMHRVEVLKKIRSLPLDDQITQMPNLALHRQAVKEHFANNKQAYKTAKLPSIYNAKAIYILATVYAASMPDEIAVRLAKGIP